MSPERTVYLVATAAPPVRHLPVLIQLLQVRGWSVCPILSPTAAAWVEPRELEDAAGSPVYTYSGVPGEAQSMPRADAVLAAPLTFNTVNKWAGGVSDTLAAAPLNELLAADIPIVAAPCVTSLLRSHPAYLSSMQRLTERGGTLLNPTRSTSKTDAGLADFHRPLVAQTFDAATEPSQ